ncbi:hypothetical protein R1sor_015876 [Riccia sorocarpa]|uniref:CCHC-type domain-containing protein n=1 Tax=Riccia sorocarpa TaxID=122646 RepID=A0ABD3HDG6_9MARC
MSDDGLFRTVGRGDHNAEAGGINRGHHSGLQILFPDTVNSANSRNHVFANSPLIIRNKMVFCLPWDPRFTPDDLRSRMTPVWVELRDLKTCLMDFALEMLQMVGPVLYAAKNVETGKSNIIPGCVMVDLNQELRDVVKVVIPEAPDRIMKQAIRYTKLPDACFICRERGHFARSCASTKNQEEESEAKQAFIPNARSETNNATRGRSTGSKRTQQQAQTTRQGDRGIQDEDDFTKDEEEDKEDPIEQFNTAAFGEMADSQKKPRRV